MGVTAFYVTLVVGVILIVFELYVSIKIALDPELRRKHQERLRQLRSQSSRVYATPDARSLSSQSSRVAKGRKALPSPGGEPSVIFPAAQQGIAAEDAVTMLPTAGGLSEEA